MMYPSLWFLVAFQAGKSLESSKFSLICMPGKSWSARRRLDAYQFLKAILAEAFAASSASLWHSAESNLRLINLGIETLQAGKGWSSQLGTASGCIQTWAKRLQVYIYSCKCIAPKNHHALLDPYHHATEVCPFYNASLWDYDVIQHICKILPYNIVIQNSPLCFNPQNNS